MTKEYNLKVFNSSKGLQRHKSNTRTNYGPGIRHLYVITYILRGKGYFNTGGKTYMLTKGDSFIIYPGITVSYYPDPEDEWEYIWVDFDGSEVEEILNNTSFSIKNPIVRAKESNILSCFEKLRITCSDKTNLTVHQYKLKSALYRLLSEYIITYPSNNNAQLSLIEKIVDYINHNFADPTLSVADIEQEFGFSHMTLYRYFNDSLNTTPKKYINSVRIEKACFMLHSKEQQIKEVSLSVGFSDPLYFSKVFKAQTGVSPSEYFEYYHKYLV